MAYLFDHTVLFDTNPLYLIPIAFMFATLFFCIFRVRKMKKELRALENELSGKLAKGAVEAPEPMMRNTLDDSQTE